MLFNSFQFLLFFPIVTIIYFLLPQKYRWIHLLISSCIFYLAFIPVYIFILIFTIVIDYFAGIMIARSEGRRRKIYLACSIVANVLVLAIFKYYNFFTENINELIRSAHLQVHDLPYLKIILPIGLSFHTFQAMSYTIEVYRKRIQPELHFGYYALYVMFYPQLVAGPIERPQNILHQLHEYHPYDHAKMVSGLRLMLWGLFKKVVIADRLAMPVNEVYNHLGQYTGISYVIATIFFGIQIYCDFSGYSDIAIGSARTMGISLMVNFKRPYFSATLSEFWRRWHISLSTWFRDYVYVPLGGNRVSNARRNFNLLCVFLISGFWHGASWNFVIWGALHGFFLLIGATLQKRFPYLTRYNFFNIAITFLLANFAWVFFRAANLHDAIQVITHLFSVQPNGSYFNITSADLNANATLLGMAPWKFFSTILLIVFLFLSDWLLEKGYVPVFDKQPIAVKWTVYYLMIITILLAGVFETNQFIYFQF